MKNTKRKAFTFLRSYFDVMNKLDDPIVRLQFLEAIINKQFLDQDPCDLSFMAEFGYESQRHQIEKSIKGWKDKTGTDVVGTPLGKGDNKPVKKKSKEVIKVNKISLDGVTLLQTEIDKLKDEFGESGFNYMVETLRNYKLASGKSYKSDYGAINSWVKDKYKDKHPAGDKYKGYGNNKTML